MGGSLGVHVAGGVGQSSSGQGTGETGKAW